MEIALFLALLTSSLALPLTSLGENWAVLVSGSYTWMNYRHQADVYHAYQLMKKHGIDESHIIVMHYDDIAHNVRNPTPGIVVNKPNGTNVYREIPKDYTGLEVTVENFLSVLRGDKSADGKVLKSGPNDHVFINFVDHGAPGLVAFPHERMYADHFFDAIQDMHDKRMFSKLVIYMEACEAGSMFQDIMPDDMNVYVVTASNSTQSSYACYFDKKRMTYLGDVFSIKWMEDEDKNPIERQTLQQQYKLVKKETITSNVSRYGDMQFTDAHLDEFMAGHSSNLTSSHIYLTLDAAFSKPTPPPHPKPIHPCEDPVPSRDVSLAILYHQVSAATTKEDIESLKRQIHSELTLRKKIAKTLDLVAAECLQSSNSSIVLEEVITNSDARPRNFNCYRTVVEHFSAQCFDLSKYDFALGQLFKLSNLCEGAVPTDTIKSALSRACA
ncbi:legumain-like [Oscarella lobularis]|uniref:legumain-like n=1 Tax=Oscarella lobularis TaxID=121494 RepID=UPI0033144B9F